MGQSFRRLFLASLFALPFITVGVVALAAWQNPPPCPNGATCPTDNNLAGPVWLQPSAAPDNQYGNISLTKDPATGQGGWVYADQGFFWSNLAGTSSVKALNGVAGSAAVPVAALYGKSLNNPAWVSPNWVGTWAGYFEGNVSVASGLLRVDNDPAAGLAGCVRYDGVNSKLQYSNDCSTNWTNFDTPPGSAGSSLWSLEGAGPNIFKTTATGIVAVGTLTPSTAGFPAGTKLALVGDTGAGPRLYLSNSTGNPELDLSTTVGATESHWGLYSDNSTKQFRLWQSSSGNQLVLTSSGQLALGSQAVADATAATPTGPLSTFDLDGVMTFRGWQATGYVLTVTPQGSGSGTVTALGINCTTGSGSGCSASYSSGQQVSLSATAAAGSAFVSWTGCTSSSGATCSVTMPASSLTVTATFTIPGSPTITLDPADGITSTQATLHARVNPNGTNSPLKQAVFYKGLNDSSRPVCGPSVNYWSSFGQAVTSFMGGTTGFIDSSISATNSTALTPSTTYDYCVVVTTVDNTKYYSANPAFLTFTTTGAVPVLTSPTAGSVTASSATLGATITSNGGSAITARGTCYGTSAAPTTNCVAEGGTTTGAFTQARSGLSANTTYIYRGYASSSAGTGYSPDGTFLTLPGAPGTPTFTSVGQTSLTVNWVAPTGGAASYKLERCQGAGCSAFSQVAAGLTGTSYNDSGLTASTSYSYRLRGTNATGDGAYSGTGSVTTTAPSPPTVTSFSPTSGSVATSVALTGTNFGGATAVKFNGTSAVSYTVNSATSITATVPSGATTGPVSVTTSAGTGTSASNFTVLTCYTLTTSVAPAGSGSVAASPTSSTGCPSGQYVSGATVQLTASASGGFAFASWTQSGGISGATGTANPVTATITGTGSATVTANFSSLASFTLTVTHLVNRGSITGSVTCGVSYTSASGSFTSGTSLTLVATPADISWAFQDWTLPAGKVCQETGDNASSTCTFTMPGSNATATANFVVNQ